ncbi:hypothetical protein HNQ85_001302 [Anoxybacillus calidus]|uniref:Uncharacterized protein n=1 Tax=[Anoxybacillus] calidus TaxID=575178 RepID=A0A7V9YZ85_9BACL|nr:hypothetical protein [Anoxybacillus calidus]
MNLKERDIEFALGDAGYGSDKVRQTADQIGIFFVSTILPPILMNEKMPTVV